ncbi:hypothetical protein ES703_31237 [subsurface metagenome]
MIPNRFPKQPQRRPESEGCRIKIKRGKDGKIKEIETSGKCSKQEVEIARENLKSESEED